MSYETRYQLGLISASLAGLGIMWTIRDMPFMGRLSSFQRLLLYLFVNCSMAVVFVYIFKIYEPS